MIVVHVILLVIVLAGHFEHRIIVPVGAPSNELSISISIVSQIFGIVS